MPSISNLPPTITIADLDLLAVVQSGGTKKVTAGTLMDEVVSRSVGQARQELSANWYAVPVGDFNPSAHSAYQIETTLTEIRPGTPVRYVVNGIVMYGLVVSVSSGIATIDGPAINTSMPITAMAWGDSAKVIQVPLLIGGAYGSPIGDKLGSVGKQYSQWSSGEARLVSFRCAHGTPATTTQPTVNIKAGGSVVSTANGNNGVTMPGSAGQWVANPPATIDVAAYVVEFGDDLEVSVTTAGTGGTTGSDLTVLAVFVLV